MFFYVFSFSKSCILVRVKEDLENIQGTLFEYALDETPVHCRAPYIHTHPSTDNLVLPIHLPICFERREETRDPRGKSNKHGKTGERHTGRNLRSGFN